jgi:long-chain fatty acid transport protein
MNLLMRKFGVFILLIVLIAPAYAGGFQVNLQGQKQTGMGHTGTSLIGGPSSLFFNPGAFSMLDSNHFSFGISPIFAKVAYLEPSPGVYTTQTEPGIGTPLTFYSSFRLKPENKWNFGLGVYTPFGSGIKYEDDWKGQAILREMSLKTIYIQPTFGWRFSEKFGIGVGYVYGFGNFLLRKAVPAQDLNEDYGEGKLTGKASGHGFNVGMYFRPSEKLAFGLSYRSGVTVAEDDGDAEFTVPSSLEEFFPTTKFSTEISLPSVINFGVTHHINDKLLVSFDANYVGWSSYDRLAFDFEDNTEKLEDLDSPRKYENVFIVRAGMQYDASEKFTARAGFYYDITPVQDGYITPETPDASKVGITVGASYRPSSKFSIDCSFLYIGAQRTGTNNETEFGGTWKSKALIPGVGVHYNF